MNDNLQALIGQTVAVYGYMYPGKVYMHIDGRLYYNRAGDEYCMLLVDRDLREIFPGDWFTFTADAVERVEDDYIYLKDKGAKCNRVGRKAS